MSFYQKNAPKIMALGFIAIVVGVILSINMPHLQMLSWMFGIGGLLLYITGRVGTHLNANARESERRKSQDDGDE